MKNVTTIHTNVTIGARQSAPVAKNDSNIGGTTHVTCCETGATKPKYVANQPIEVATSGAIMNGINMIAFNTIGRPNITGSLILNTPGPIDNFATVR